MPLSELEQEFYADEINITPPETPADDVTPPADDIITPHTDEVVVPHVQETPPAPPVDGNPPPPYKSKKFIEVEDEKALYSQLHSKYQYENMSPEQKALAYIKQTNPGLDDDEIAFLAASDYNIGVEKPDEADMTDEQLRTWRKQEISRKQLLSKADGHFAEEAAKVALADYDPLDLDPDYKEYRTTAQQQAAQAQEKQEKITQINTEMENSANAISEITKVEQIDIDGSKLAVPISFKLDKEQQTQLADFAKRYTPTKAEYDAFNDPKTGKFDYNGYVESLAPMAFANQISKAGIRQALTTDRANFIEKELKNSTLRNNDVSATTEKPFDIVDAWVFG